MKAKVNQLRPATMLASVVQGARRRGDLSRAERFQRRLVEHSKQRFGLRNIVTAASMFDLVTILELQEKTDEAKQLRLIIREILDRLPTYRRPSSSATGDQRQSA